MSGVKKLSPASKQSHPSNDQNIKRLAQGVKHFPQKRGKSFFSSKLKFLSSFLASEKRQYFARGGRKGYGTRWYPGITFCKGGGTWYQN